MLVLNHCTCFQRALNKSGTSISLVSPEFQTTSMESLHLIVFVDLGKGSPETVKSYICISLLTYWCSRLCVRVCHWDSKRPSFICRVYPRWPTESPNHAQITIMACTVTTRLITLCKASSQTCSKNKLLFYPDTQCRPITVTVLCCNNITIYAGTPRLTEIYIWPPG